jgi:hypothetical protein
LVEFGRVGWIVEVRFVPVGMTVIVFVLLGMPTMFGVLGVAMSMVVAVAG